MTRRPDGWVQEVERILLASMGEIREREYLRFAVEQESVCALAQALRRVVEERAATRPQ